MKKEFLLPSIIFLTLSGVIACKKEMNGKEAVPVTGSWDWSETYGGGNPSSPGYLQTPAISGKTETIQFDKNGKWKHIANGVADDSGNYSIGHGRYIESQFATFEYDSVAFFKDGLLISSDSYEITGDTLVYSGFFQGIVGGPVKKWLKNSQP